ncbi:hypothetical protein Tco_0553443 [Tanacetum coccineum]
MTTPVEKRNHTKFCEFHGEVGHNTDECMHLKKQIEEMLKVGKLSHLIKDLKQNSGKEQPKTAKKREITGKDKALAILMVQPWERVARQKITQSFSPNIEILFPPLDEDEGTKFRPKIKNQLAPATTHLIGFSGEIIWPIGKIQLLVRIGDEEHSASAWMNFVVVRPEEISQAPKPIVEERVKVAINTEYPEQTIMIGFTLTEEGRNKLCDLLQRNLDIFAWKPADMTGVLRHC